MADTVTRVVVADAFNWQTPVEGQPGRYELHTARRDETVELPVAEAERGDAIVLRTLPNGREIRALYTPEEYADVVAEQNAAEAAGLTGTWSDADLADANAEELVAYVNQFPGELERVVTLEEQRDKQRKTILALRDEAAGEREPDPGDAPTL